MMRGAKAQVSKTITKEVKGRKPVVTEKTMSVKLPKTEELIGDGNANVARSKTIKLGLPYGAASISATCTVSLTCNQDDKTILRTARLCTKINDKLLEDDQVEMAKFISEMREELGEE